MAGSSMSSRLFPRSATRSCEPKYGDPAPDCPAAPNAGLGVTIWTALTTVPSVSPPTIQARPPTTATPAWETGTWRRPARSIRFRPGWKAQTVSEVDSVTGSATTSAGRLDFDDRGAVTAASAMAGEGPPPVVAVPGPEPSCVVPTPGWLD